MFSYVWIKYYDMIFMLLFLLITSANRADLLLSRVNWFRPITIEYFHGFSGEWAPWLATSNLRGPIAQKICKFIYTFKSRGFDSKTFWQCNGIKNGMEHTFFDISDIYILMKVYYFLFISSPQASEGPLRLISSAFEVLFLLRHSTLTLANHVQK